jgi:hypothetical protein
LGHYRSDDVRVAKLRETATDDRMLGHQLIASGSRRVQPALAWKRTKTSLALAVLVLSVGGCHGRVTPQMSTATGDLRSKDEASGASFAISQFETNGASAVLRWNETRRASSYEVVIAGAYANGE